MSNGVSAIGGNYTSHIVKKRKGKEAEDKDTNFFSNRTDYDKMVEQHNKKQLEQDFAYFTELMNKIQSGDISAAQEASTIKAGSFDKARNSNAQQYNKNTSFLLNLQKLAKGLLNGKDEGKDKKEEGNNPFQR